MLSSRLLVVAALVAACSSAAPAPSTPTPPTPSPSAAPVASGPCNDVEVCLAACDTGDAARCRRAGELMLQAPPRGAGPLDPRVLAAIDARCAASDGAACWLAGAMQCPEAAKCGAAGRAALDRGCELRSGHACILAALMAADDPTGDPRLEQGIELTRAGCDAGDHTSCAYLVDALMFVPEESTYDAVRAEQAALRRACDADDAIACNRLAMILQLEDREGSREARRRACLLSPNMTTCPR